MFWRDGQEFVRRWCSRVAVICLPLGLMIGPAWGAEIVNGSGPGSKIYVESFDDVAAVDSAAGATPGLDQTVVEPALGALRQLSGAAAGVETAFDALPDDYDYDPSKIELSNGIAALKADPLWPHVSAYWRFEAPSWSGVPGEVVDQASSAAGSIVGGAQTVDGLVGRAATFDGSGDAVVLGQGSTVDLDPSGEFSLAVWFRTAGDGALIAKADSDFGARQFYLFVAGGSLWGAVGGQQHQGTSGGVSDNQWHHGVLVNEDDGGSLRFTLYLDGVADGTFDSGTVSNVSDVLLGARRDSGNSGLAFQLNGQLDEALVFDRALSADEVQGLFNGGSGRVLAPYPVDRPAITQRSGYSLFNVSTVTGFAATPSPDHAGELTFQLSADGVTWQTWDGTAWVTAGDGATDPAAGVDGATVQANIAAFDVSAEALFVRTLLGSDGQQRSGIDHLALTYDRDPVFSAREVLGPITGSAGFDRLQATVTGIDSAHTVRLRVLGSDAETPVSDATLPGNGAGFEAAGLGAPGVDLASLPAGDHYLEAEFVNLLGDGASAYLESFQVEYREVLSPADVAVDLAGPVAPLTGGEAFTLDVLVSNTAVEPVAEPTLTVTLPQELQLISMAAPGTWTCVGTECSASELEPGSSVAFTLTLQVADVTTSVLVSVDATVAGQNDSTPDNNTAGRQFALDPAVAAQVRIVHGADPADGTDMSYLVSGSGVVQLSLDDALPDDGDAVVSEAVLPLVAGQGYSVEQQTPVGWVLDDVQCTSPTVAAGFDQAWTLAAESIFDTTSVTVEDGVARLRRDPIADAVVANWRFESGPWSGAADGVLDSAGQGFHGTALGDAETTGDGLLGQAVGFDGQGDAVLLGQAADLDFDPTQPFSLSLWFRTTGDGALIAKADGNFNQRQFYLFVAGDRLWGAVGGSQHQGASGGVSDGQWHHAVLVNRPQGNTSSFVLYLDGNVEGTFPSGSAGNGSDILLGARRDQGNSGLAFHLNGDLDEVAMLDRAVSSGEVQSLYAEGQGRLLGGYPTHGPSITASMGGADSGWLAFTGFREEPGLGHEGGLGYQLSTDGSTWHWFNGIFWVPAQSHQHNTASTVDAAIAQFPFNAEQDALFVRAFLLSDGSQQAALDRVRVFYSSSGLGGVQMDGQGVSIDTALSPDVTCQFDTSADTSGFGALTIIQTSTPSDGTNFPYSAQIAGQTVQFELDDAYDVGDDGDGVDSVQSWDQLAPGLQAVQLGTLNGWYLSDIECMEFDNRVFVTPYDDAADYTFDPDAIEVSGGIAQLVQDPLYADLLGYWSMDEDSWNGGAVIDGSTLGHDGTPVGDAESVDFGLVGGAGSFDGVGDGVDLGQPVGLDLDPANDAFTVSAWFRTTGDGAIIGKAEDAFGERQIYLFIAGGQVHANVGGVQNAGSGSFADGAWHHVVLINTLEGGSAEHLLFVDGVQRGNFTSGSAMNQADWMIGARRQSGNVGTAFGLDGEVDEVAIFGRDLSASEVDVLYADGQGRSLNAYSAQGPSIVKTLGDSAPFLRPLGFQVVQSAGDSADLGFQLSADGSTWYYWNGVAWAPALDSDDMNSATTIDVYMRDFEIFEDSLYVKVFFLSDGSRAVALDEIRVLYDQLDSVDTHVEFDGGTLTVDLQAGQDVRCFVAHEQDLAPEGSLTVFMHLDFHSPQDFPSTLTRPDGSVEHFVLDDAFPDDEDGHDYMFVADDLIGGDYTLQSSLPAGWERRDVECVDEASSDSAFRLDYGVADRFAFDPEKIVVRGGAAELRIVPLNYDLLAYWQLDAASWDGTAGEVIDASHNDHHGTSFGGTTTADGLIGGAADFDGTTGYVSFGAPQALDLQPSEDPFTLMAWFRTEGDGAIVGKAGGTLAERQFYLFVLDGKLWSIVGGELHSVASSPSVADGQWHQAVLVNYPAGGGVMRHRLYLDGVPQGDFASGSATNSADILIGARRADDVGGGVAFQLDGRVDEVMILDRDLSSEEVSDLYAEGEGRRITFYPTDEPTMEQLDYFSGDVLEVLPLSFGGGDELAFQVDFGDGQWQYWQGWNGAGWQPATLDTHRNTMEEVLAGLDALAPASLRFRIKTFFISDGTEPAFIGDFTIHYHEGRPLDFEVLGDAVSVEIMPGSNVTCRLYNQQGTASEGTLTLRVNSEPADGTNFVFELDPFEILLLDDADPDDGDGIGDTRVWTFDSTSSPTVNMLLSGAPEWALRSIECTGNSFPEEYMPDEAHLQVTTQLGEDVVCELNYEAWFQRTATLEAVTSTAPASVGPFAADAAGQRLMVTAAADLSADNPELDPEVFAFDAPSDVWRRLTNDPNAATGRVDVSAGGRWGVVPMDGDLTGANPERNPEIFRFDAVSGDVVQVTDSLDCEHFEPRVSDDGRRVVLTRDCTSGEGATEIVLMDELVTVPMAQSVDCSSHGPRISADGLLVTFVSECDWVGLNPDLGPEIFQWRWQDGPSAIDQLTDVDSFVGVYVSSHQVSDDGRYVWMLSNKFAYPALPGDDALVRMDLATGARRYIEPLDILPYPIHPKGFETPYLPMAADASGRHVVFYGHPWDEEPYQGPHFSAPNWYWAEFTAAGDMIYNRIALDDPLPLGLGLVGRVQVTWDGAGLPVVYLLSGQDFDGSNGDLGEEIWRVTFE